MLNSPCSNPSLVETPPYLVALTAKIDDRLSNAMSSVIGWTKPECFTPKSQESRRMRPTQ